tara:strand:- start:189 stop:398 length:210 start_codon:yes stop_codon:yes gene_type:complete
VTKLTLEQEFKVASLLGDIEKATPEQTLEICQTLLKHNFLLKNTLNNIIDAWHELDATGADIPEERSPS